VLDLARAGHPPEGIHEGTNINYAGAIHVHQPVARQAIARKSCVSKSLLPPTNISQDVWKMSGSRSKGVYSLHTSASRHAVRRGMQQQAHAFCLPVAHSDCLRRILPAW